MKQSFCSSSGCKQKRAGAYSLLGATDDKETQPQAIEGGLRPMYMALLWCNKG